MIWTEDSEGCLRRLWGEGKSLNAIAEVLGCSRNAVAGKSRRLRLERRESPIKRDTTPKPVSLVELKANSCRWTIGDPGSPGFGFCGALTLPGRSYCPQHHARVYVQKQPRNRDQQRDDTAA